VEEESLDHAPFLCRSAGVSYRLTFWGTRGSIPTPGPQTARYGGNTACISITHGDGRLTILDAGSGLRPLGHELMTRPGRTLTADVLLSHTHWDHIQGLPFFKPLSARGNRFCVYGAAQEGVPLEEILRRQMDPMVFPVPLEALAARIEVREIVDERSAEEARFVGSPTIRIDGEDVQPPPADEPIGLTCRIYRLRDDRVSPTPDPADVRDALKRAIESPERKER